MRKRPGRSHEERPRGDHHERPGRNHEEKTDHHAWPGRNHEEGGTTKRPKRNHKEKGREGPPRTKEEPQGKGQGGTTMNGRNEDAESRGGGGSGERKIEKTLCEKFSLAQTMTNQFQPLALVT
ncbi:hypothetical protein EDD22DRAFT_843544 [Suillus occidentalis]|nr:hypothetical protein EDD22DRAFT_843544 [Suillus occidentalis]